MPSAPSNPIATANPNRSSRVGASTGLPDAIPSLLKSFFALHCELQTQPVALPPLRATRPRSAIKTDVNAKKMPARPPAAAATACPEPAANRNSAHRTARSDRPFTDRAPELSDYFAVAVGPPGAASARPGVGDTRHPRRRAWQLELFLALAAARAACGRFTESLLCEPNRVTAYETIGCTDSADRTGTDRRAGTGRSVARQAPASVKASRQCRTENRASMTGLTGRCCCRTVSRRTVGTDGTRSVIRRDSRDRQTVRY